MLPRVHFILKQAISVSLRSFGVTLVATVSVAVALTVLAAFAVVVQTLGRTADQLAKEVEISAYLRERVTVDQALSLTQEVRRWPQVTEVRYLTSEAALAEFAESLGEDARLLEGLPAGVLPASLEVAIHPEAWTRANLEVLGARLSAFKEIEDVRFGQEDIEEINAILSASRVVAAVLSAALIFATVLLVANTIRLAVYARRDEIEVMSLVGATRSFVRAPFVVEGALQGLVGSVLAFSMVLALQEVLHLVIARGISTTVPLELVFDPVRYLAGLTLVGLSLGVAGSLIAVGHFLRV